MKPGWQEKSLGQVGKIFNGDSINENEKKRCFQGLTEGTPYIGTKDVGFDHQINYNSGTKIPFKRANDFKLAPTKAVLVCAEGGSAGRKVAFTEREVFFGNKLFAICPEEQKSSRFVYYFCLSDSFAKQFKGAMSGLIGGVSINKFKNIKIPFPALNEQQQIATKLDQVFEGLAKAKENAEKNLQNARALFESHLESVFNQRGPGWAEKPLGKVCDLQNGYAFKSGDYINASNTLNIRMSNIRPGGSFDPEHNQRFLPDSYARKYAAFLLREGDLIIAMTDMAGDPKILGVPTLVGNLDGRNFLMNQRVGKLFGFSADVRPPYLRYFLTSPLVKQFYKSKGAGGLQINISKGDILSVKIPLPDVTNQDLVVKQLDALTEETQRLARLYEQKLEALESFKKSILHEAFSGNL